MLLSRPNTFVIRHEPQNRTTDIRRTVCAFHQEYPEFIYSQCTCSTSYVLRDMTESEKEEMQAYYDRLAQREAEAREKYGY